jgi:hypothetical protein
MTIAPPRPADAGDVTREPGPDTTSLRRQADGLRLGAAMMLVPMAVLLAVAVAEHRMWAPLTRDGVRAPAEVVGASSWRWSDRIRVAFATPDGRLVEASIPVGDLSRYAKGATVEVAYDPVNPRRVRTVENWNPPYAVPLGVGAVLALLALGFAWRAWRWPRRLSRIAAQDRAGRAMVLASVTVAGRTPVPWAVLWDRDAPPAARPELAFRLADAEDAPDGAVDVELVAEPRRRAVGFARTAAGVIWPAGKIRPLPRSVRRAVEKAERDLSEAESRPEVVAPAVAGTPAGAALADLRGDLPPLPPEFFEAARPRKTASPKVLLAIVPMLLAVTGPFALSEIVESHRQMCPKPPPATAGAPGVLPAEALPSTLPASLAGYTPGSERVRGMASFANPATVAALVNAGYISGYERNFVAGTMTVKVEVFQFDSDLGPVLYESKRLATQCTFQPKRLPVPAGSGVSGVVLQGPERPIHRMTFVRGDRDYIVNMEGFGVTGEAEVLARVLDAAR